MENVHLGEIEPRPYVVVRWFEVKAFDFAPCRRHGAERRNKSEKKGSC